MELHRIRRHVTSNPLRMLRTRDYQSVSVLMKLLLLMLVMLSTSLPRVVKLR